MIQTVSSGRNKLDSVKLSFPAESLISKRDSAFRSIVQYGSTGEVISESFLLDSKAQISRDTVGLKGIKLIGEWCEIEISAKVLREQYHELINLQNVEQVVSRINRMGIIELNTALFLDQAEVCRLDCTSDLHVSGEPGDFLQSLKAYGALHPKYETTAYKRTGFVFKKKVSSYKERVLLYDKYTEVMRDKHRDILRPEMFVDVVRVETGHTDKKHIRERFNVDKKQVLLMDILKSKEPVNFKLFTSIIDSPDIAEAMARFDALRSQGGKLSAIEKRKGREGIIRDCNHDMELVRLFLKGAVKGNISHIIRRYSDTLADMIGRGEGNEETRASAFDTDHINEMRELLKVA